MEYRGVKIESEIYEKLVSILEKDKKLNQLLRFAPSSQRSGIPRFIALLAYCLEDKECYNKIVNTLTDFVPKLVQNLGNEDRTIRLLDHDVGVLEKSENKSETHTYNNEHIKENNIGLTLELSSNIYTTGVRVCICLFMFLYFLHSFILSLPHGTWGCISFGRVHPV